MTTLTRQYKDSTSSYKNGNRAYLMKGNDFLLPAMCISLVSLLPLDSRSFENPSENKIEREYDYWKIPHSNTSNKPINISSSLTLLNVLLGDSSNKYESKISEFLSKNLNILSALPSIFEYIQNELGENIKLDLDMLDEGELWQTLFISIHASISWEEWDKFRDSFFDYLFDEFPNCTNGLNITIIPNEL